MLAKVTAEFPHDWDRYLLAILFAYRKVPQKLTRFSSNEIIFGSSLTGLLSLVRVMWVIPDIQEYKTYIQDVHRWQR